MFRGSAARPQGSHEQSNAAIVASLASSVIGAAAPETATIGAAAVAEGGPRARNGPEECIDPGPSRALAADNEPVRVEISGFGPTDLRYVDRANAPNTPEGQ